MAERYNIESYEDAPKKIKDKVLEIIVLEEKVDNSPDRYYRYTNIDGEIETMDLKWPLVALQNKIRLQGVDDQFVTELTDSWSRFRKVIVKKSNLVRQLNKLQIGTSGAGKAKLKSLMDTYKSTILELMGEGRTNENIVDYFRDKSLKITKNQVIVFRQKHQNQIKDLWTQHLLNDKEFNIATDKGRLQALSDMEYYYKQKFDREKLKQDVKEHTVKTRQGLLEQIRKEVKGDVIHHKISGKIDIDATINANKVLMENMSKIPINMMIIAMTAAKRGINPLLLQAALANSYYAKYNGFNGLPPDALDDDLVYPSMIVKTYDLNQMVDNNNKDQGEGRFSEATVVDDFREKELEIKHRSLKEILEEKKRNAGFK